MASNNVSNSDGCRSRSYVSQGVATMQAKHASYSLTCMYLGPLSCTNLVSRC